MRVIELNTADMGYLTSEMVVLVRRKTDGHKLNDENFKQDAEKLVELFNHLPNGTLSEFFEIAKTHGWC